MAVRSTMNRARYVPQTTAGASIRQAWAALMEMARARQTRRLLAEMDDRMLSDIGVGRGDALMEAARAPWDLGSRR